MPAASLIEDEPRGELPLVGHRRAMGASPSTTMRLARIRIVSGGQTGVDRGALDAALELGAPCGGWCPKGRLAEDGPIPARYPLLEMPTPAYRARTRQNVIDSDGTLVLTFGEPTGGTAHTLELCRQLAKPMLVIAGETTPVAQAVERLRRFVAQRAIAVLNVAGPRASGEPRGYEYARQVVRRLLVA